MDSVYPIAPNQSLPTMYDLPSEDPEEPGLPDEFHSFQPQLLRETCRSVHYPADQMFMGTDLNLYYDARHPQWHKRPDWFLVLGVEPANQQADLRWSYVIWQEGVAPFLVVELLSPGTEAEDLGQTLREVNQPPTKWQVYEQILRVPYYALFDRYENQFRVFELVGTRYRELELTEQQLWLEELQLGLGVWHGTYQGAEGLWLRWWSSPGDWVSTAAEQAEQERQRVTQAEASAEQERQRATQAEALAEQERQRAQRLAAQLRELGIEPDRFGETQE
jgi:Uma2 family endonuclease